MIINKNKDDKHDNMINNDNSSLCHDLGRCEASIASSDSLVVGRSACLVDCAQPYHCKDDP